MRRCPLDGEQMALYRSRVPEGADREKQLREFAILCGAAAACAAPFNDPDSEVGAALSQEERDEWASILHLLMRLADLHTWGAEGTRAQVIAALGALALTMQDNG